MSQTIPSWMPSSKLFAGCNDLEDFVVLLRDLPYLLGQALSIFQLDLVITYPLNLML